MKIERFINVYSDGKAGMPWSSLEDARKHQETECNGIVQLTIDTETLKVSHKWHDVPDKSIWVVFRDGAHFCTHDAEKKALSTIKTLGHCSANVFTCKEFVEKQ